MYFKKLNYTCFQNEPFDTLLVSNRLSHIFFIRHSFTFFSPDGYSEDGCHVDTAKSNSEETVCRCNHLTYFAVLVDFDSGGTKVFFFF